MAPYQQPGNLVPLYQVAHRKPASRGIVVAARAAVGFAAGVVAVALVGAAIENHRWINLAAGFPPAWLVGAALMRKRSLAVGFIGGVAAAVGLLGAFTIWMVLTWHLGFGGS